MIYCIIIFQLFIEAKLLYFDLLTRPKMPFNVMHREEVTHPDRQISEEIAEAWRRVHISAWEFEGNIRPTNWTEYSWVELKIGRSWRQDVVRKATPGRRGSREPWLNWRPEENEKDTTLPIITLGSKHFSYVLFPARSHMQTLSNPFRTLAIKWELNIFIKKSSCVCLCHCVLIIVSLWCCRWRYNKMTQEKHLIFYSQDGKIINRLLNG